MMSKNIPSDLGLAQFSSFFGLCNAYQIVTVIIFATIKWCKAIYKAQPCDIVQNSATCVRGMYIRYCYVNLNLVRSVFLEIKPLK